MGFQNLSVKYDKENVFPFLGIKADATKFLRGIDLEEDQISDIIGKLESGDTDALDFLSELETAIDFVIDFDKMTEFWIGRSIEDPVPGAFSIDIHFITQVKFELRHAGFDNETPMLFLLSADI